MARWCCGRPAHKQREIHTHSLDVLHTALASFLADGIRQSTLGGQAGKLGPAPRVVELNCSPLQVHQSALRVLLSWGCLVCLVVFGSQKKVSHSLVPNQRAANRKRPRTPMARRHLTLEAGPRCAFVRAIDSNPM